MEDKNVFQTIPNKSFRYFLFNYATECILILKINSSLKTYVYFPVVHTFFKIRKTYLLSMAHIL